MRYYLTVTKLNDVKGEPWREVVHQYVTCNRIDAEDQFHDAVKKFPKAHIMLITSEGTLREGWT